MLFLVSINVGLALDRIMHIIVAPDGAVAVNDGAGLVKACFKRSRVLTVKNKFLAFGSSIIKE